MMFVLTGWRLAEERSPPAEPIDSRIVLTPRRSGSSLDPLLASRTKEVVRDPPTDPTLRSRSAGAEVTAAVSGTGKGLACEAGDTLIVVPSNAPQNGAGRGLILETASREELAGATSGITVEPLDPADPSAPTQRLIPRAGVYEYAVESAAPSFRIITRTAQQIRRISTLSGSASVPTLTAILASRAIHSRIGDVGAAIAPGDSLLVSIVPGDTLVLRFEGGASGSGLDRQYVLETRGQTTLVPIAEGALASRNVIPDRFQLLQNRPNPFSAATVIDFDLAQRAEAQVEIFDVAGRRVRVLRTGSLPPGSHSVTWDRRDSGGRAVAPGIYLYRLQAGTFADRKRMVLVP